MNQQQAQQLPQQQPSVVIVQQPVVVANGPFTNGAPFLRRGLKLNNGTRIGPCVLIALGIIGFILFFIGIPISRGVSPFLGIMFVILGIGAIAVLVKFCHKAKQDYDALPPDHPDRIKYSTPQYSSRGRNGALVPIVTPNTYHFATGTQVITSHTALQPGQVITNYELPPGAQVIHAPTSFVPGGASSSQGLPIHIFYLEQYFTVRLCLLKMINHPPMMMSAEILESSSFF